MTTFFLACVLCLGVVGAGYFYWSRQTKRALIEDAKDEWAALKRSDPAIIKGYTEKQFAAVYSNVHFPRFPGYALAAFSLFAVSLPVTLGALNGLVWVADKIGLLPETLEIVRYVPIGEDRAVDVGGCTTDCQMYLAENFAGFYYFFGVMAVWLMIFAYFMRRFYAKRPGYLRDELIRNRPEEEIT